ncbi:MAG: ATP-binding protein [Butyricicoccus sp.]
MKKRLFRTLCALSFLGVMIAAVTITFFSVRFHMRQIELSLQETAQTIATSYQKLNDLEQTSVLLDALSPNIRATLIDAEGTVLYETVASAETMENHLNRPEIQSAIKNGTGEISRQSATLRAKTYYYAVRLNDGNVLRLAREYSNMYGVIGQIVLIILLCSVFLTIVAVILSRRLTIWLIRPVVHLADHITNLKQAEVYEELEPFIQHIREQNDQIDQQKSNLERERETLDVITRNMKEGVLFVSADRSIASVNPSAIAMLSGQKGETDEKYIGRTFLLLNRTRQWYECISNALQGENAEQELTYQGKIYRLFASPVSHLRVVDGAVVIILDVTQERLAEQSRQEFSANVSHELKTPLTSISGYAEMMELDMVPQKADQIEFARRIHKEALRLIALINDIIRLSRIEEGAPKAFELIELNEMCRDAVDSLGPVAEQAGVELLVSGDCCHVMGEESMLTELVYNLSENAIKYNKYGGHVWVTTQKQNEEAMIEVRDDGIGIPEDSVNRVFERFYRVDKSRSKQTGGTGLGLSIVKHIVEYHDGRVEIKSELGVGTTIRVWLPLPPLHDILEQ